MVVTKDSPHRRRSLAVVSNSQPAAVPRRRRAHSIAPRTSLSPQAKARRLLVPRKSILKTSFTAEELDENDGTQSMELTKVHDASRKSLGFNRRVSFAEHAHVRIFQIPNKDHTNSTGSPHSSPSSASSEPDDHSPAQVNDENDYPNAANFARRRRSSVCTSFGSDMDLTSVGGMLGGPGDIGSAILDEEFDDDMEMDMSDDMDVTQAIPANIRRRSSVAPGRRETLGHPPSAILQMEEDQGEDPDLTQSSVAEDSLISETSNDDSQQMEFTVPMGKSLRPPPEQDAAWLALRQATHSGDTSIEPQEESFDESLMRAPAQPEMPLDSAIQRLMRARESLSQQSQSQSLWDETNELSTIQEDTVSSMGSIDHDEGGNSNHTLNISKVMGRFSLGGNNRMSTGGESNMDESEVYGNIVAAQSGPSRQSFAPPPVADEPSSNQEQPQPPSVFHPPQPSNPPSAGPSSLPQMTQSGTSRVFSQPPPSPSKTRPTTPSSAAKARPKPTFTAAFAPPVSKTSPKKVPSKRLQREESDIENVDADRPSPAKRQALADKGADTAHKPTTAQASSSATMSKPKPFTPSKQAQASTSAAERPGSQLRQPTGYLARRKSLATGLGSQPGAFQSPMRRAVSAGRASMGSGAQDAWKRFDKSNPPVPPTTVVPTPSQPEREPMDEDPAPETQPDPQTRSPSPREEPVASPRNVDLSAVLSGPTFGDMDEDVDTAQDKAERWRAGVQEAAGEDDYEDEDIPAISIAQFFELTGIKFMDEIAAPRRSIHPGQQLSRRPRPKEDIGLAEYAVAMAIDIPQLELYTRVSRDLEAWMEKSKIAFAEAEEEAAKVTPELFVEYSRADEEGQAELLHQLNFIKTNARGSAKSDWYDWKLKWVEGLKSTADRAFEDLQSDAKKLEALDAAAKELIPDLEKEYEEIMAELEREQAEVADIEASDQDYLTELKTSIADQNFEIEALKGEVDEHKQQLTWLNERLRETEQQKQEVSSAIAKAERVLQIQKSSTRAEVFQLKDELDALEDLHLTRIIKVNAQVFEFIYDSTYRVSIPCTNFVPIVSKVNIMRLEHTRTTFKDDFPKLTNLFVACAAAILDEERDLTVRHIVRRLSDYWVACGQLRSHIRLLNIKYPVEVEIAPPSSKTPTPTFKARATLMFPKVMGKAIVSFSFNLQTFSEWPLSIDSLECDAEVSYGSVDRSEILKAIVNRITQATPSDNYALLDSCIDAQSLYS
ncbi:hypothetical protein CC1G_10294 [Coprinopsis cinerea okayama7|uniref:Spc7 kinetochore protein domain-containing protein n=1 Tax=Coprinopsis cinerea (strain Okayama-7 / 130 / ATCC MYA-4618 / FGSC 9003) TaxID=240176 RepID=A8N175_COPC7|nr:hypothetical protein CC1G_10294 [Coprinopsis cinerea okayama7\|eukprot:XP_001828623.1 hypothetical protein CC1G_10294 [Coprinopsis cinerea okayama7\